ncbi:MAG: hypothetical protein LBB79_01055, partial [Prevotellaceae bacterium]|nr:hypothetical protein [Prevotellaceae bacterium]
MKKILVVVVLLATTLFATQNANGQSPDESSISLGIGYGVDYGGFGGKISINPMPRFAVVGGIGNYLGSPPLSMSDFDNDERFTGIGYSVGIEYFYRNNRTCGGGLHYIRTGKYNEETSLQGINWCLFGGDIYFDSVPLFIHYGVNMDFISYKKHLFGMFGVSIG